MGMGDHDFQIWLAAQLLLKHGVRAQAIASRHEREWHERGDSAAASLWREIGEAVKAIEAASGPMRTPLTLPDLLAGPTARQMMLADGVDEGEVTRLMERAKREQS